MRTPVVLVAGQGDEMDRPHGWHRYDDPFGDWHEDPCYETPDMAGEFSAHRNSDGEAR